MDNITTLLSSSSSCLLQIFTVYGIYAYFNLKPHDADEINDRKNRSKKKKEKKKEEKKEDDDNSD